MLYLSRRTNYRPTCQSIIFAFVASQALSIATLLYFNRSLGVTQDPEFWVILHIPVSILISNIIHGFFALMLSGIEFEGEEGEEVEEEGEEVDPIPYHQRERTMFIERQR